MSDSKKQLELEKELEQLDEELEEYCWNVRELSDLEKNDIKDLYTLWKTCLNKKIIVKDLHDTNIRVNHEIKCGTEILWTNVKIHHTLHFISCSNITIIVNPKVNHITLENCQNVNFRVVGGSISGIDIINSTNITCVFNASDVSFIDISNTTQCLFILSESVARNIMINVAHSFNLNFKTVDNLTGVTKNVYKTNMNIFSGISIYKFDNDNLVLKI